MTEQAMLRTVLGKSERGLYIRTGQLFERLLTAQWLAAVVLALVLSPYGWAGLLKTTHIHVLAALILGGLINALPLVLLKTSPDSPLTRHVVAIAQLLWSALLIAITGGRIETHFHIFVSLAFLSLYRDWRVLLTGSLIVAGDHLARGLFWPESVYGIANPEWWRFLEHAGWVVFEDIVLAFACIKSRADMTLAAQREVALELLNSGIEHQVALRTNELRMANVSLADEMRSRLQLEVELRQAQKLESVGRLAAGIAHEINTPVQFVSDNVFFVREAVADLFEVVESLDILRRSVQDGLPALRAAQAAAAAEEEADLDYLRTNVPQALDRAIDGLDRVAVIVRAMKEFAHPDQKDATPIDLNQAIRSTLTMARSEYKDVAEVSTDLAELPPVVCYAGDLNQAILNVIVNAAHAIGDVVAGTDRKGTIHVRTWRDGDDAVISVADSGGGIPSDAREHIFEPFFTTKEVGRGTGQGLALTWSIIVDKHRGKISFETELGTGTTFFLRLPINGAAAASALTSKRATSKFGDSTQSAAPRAGSFSPYCHRATNPRGHRGMRQEVKSSYDAPEVCVSIKDRWRWHSRVQPGACLSAVLYDSAGGKRHRSRLGDRARHLAQQALRLARLRKRGRHGHDLHGSLARCPRSPVAEGGRSTVRRRAMPGVDSGAPTCVSDP